MSSKEPRLPPTSSFSKSTGGMPRGASKNHQQQHKKNSSSSRSSRRKSKSSKSNVRGLLSSLNLLHHFATFEREEIDLAALKELGEADLEDLGVADRAERNAIMRAVKKV